jgi:outer membrane protein assembly factor BamB
MRLMLLLPLLLAADWPQWMGPNRDGISPEKNNLAPWGKDGPKKLWNHEIGSGWSSPIVAEDRVYIHHRVKNTEIVSVLDAASGKLLLELKTDTQYSDDFNFDDGPRATPLWHDKKLYTLGAEGNLSCFDTQTGQLLWGRNLNREYQVPKGFFGVATSPMIVGDRLLINVGGKGAGIVALNLATGKEIWKVGNDGVSYSSPVVGKIDNEELAIFFTRQGLLAVTPDKGEIRYQQEWRPRIASSVNAANPIVSENRIFLSTSYSRGAICLEAAKGNLKELWSGDDSMSCHFNTPVLKDGLLFGIDGRQEGGGNLRCVEFATGKVRWTEKRFGCASLIVLNEQILALTESGELVLFEAKSNQYQELCRAKIAETTCRASLAYSNGRVFARESKKLIALRLK